jgi:hypothetical protein
LEGLARRVRLAQMQPRITVTRRLLYRNSSVTKPGKRREIAAKGTLTARR